MKWLIYGFGFTFIICTWIAYYRFSIGFTGFDLYAVYPFGLIAYSFFIFVIFIITGGEFPK